MAWTNGRLADSGQRVPTVTGRVVSVREKVVRHLAVGESCPIDGATVSRTMCSACPSFVSYRASAGTATVGCRWGEDVAGWLRREMDGPGPQPGATFAHGRDRHRQSRAAGWVRGGLAASTSFAIFLTAFGVGLVLAAFERPD